MSQRKTFFASLPGKIISLEHHEVRLEVTRPIELPSGACAEQTFQLRLGKIFPAGYKHHMFKCITSDGETELPGLEPTRWRALKYLIEAQGLEELVSKRKAEIALSYKKHLSWKLALAL